MSLIQAGGIGAVAVYVTLALIEVTEHELILPESAGIVILLIGFGLLIYGNTKKETEIVVKRTEMLLLPGCIILFVLYAALRTGGFL